eukprot:TRINITY_DN20667_c0_g1_i1.p1 TRINITY_DN20667_c0_g1~~TRINITY_DN20667_c0_g1_i1.p1  ORF type:complete len:228 (+),score=22.16 TRINITY_DN20667_c0_g1_i1:152-835(+)
MTVGSCAIFNVLRVAWTLSTRDSHDNYGAKITIPVVAVMTSFDSIHALGHLTGGSVGFFGPEDMPDLPLNPQLKGATLILLIGLVFMHFTRFFEVETILSSDGPSHTICAVQACLACGLGLTVAFASTTRYVAHFFSSVAVLQLSALLPHILVPTRYSGFKMHSLCLVVVGLTFATILNRIELAACDYLFPFGGHNAPDVAFSVVTSIAFIQAEKLLTRASNKPKIS